ncbi:hypothetical protein JG688_00017835 [Phytophthora aleatoria]|uniref:Uncharacterized protein n=1 Tax=Phytophthora aleatoria TaxID=2496075 RepID=A0A8J5IS64_9STRA|nr:hypothetical protein JG688_00017835 [Phytophthora aleatoria]
MITSRYKAELVKLVLFKDDKKDDVGRNVTTEELLCITPDLLCRWTNKRAYGDPEPNEDMRPIHIRSSTLEIAKKAISAFMPRLNTKALPSHDVLQPTTTLSSLDGQIVEANLSIVNSRQVTDHFFKNIAFVSTAATFSLALS